MYKNEVVDLNEVVQFQLLVNLPSDTTPSSIMHCTLQLNLLHDKQKPATGRRKGVPTEVEHSWNLNVVSTAVYSLRVQAKGIHEMIPITFSSPYFVCLDGMINCALLYIVPSKLMNNAAVLGKEREIGNRNIPSPSVTMTTTTITDDDSLPSSKWKDCSQEYVDQSGIYTSAHMEMIVESLDSIVSALQWLLALEPIQPGKEDAFLNGLTFNDSMLNDIVILLRSMNSNLRFSSLIQYFKRGGASYFKRNSSPHSSSQPMQAQHGKGSLGDSLEENSFSYSPTETIENHICLISQLCFMEWNVFFVLLPSRRGQILDNLRCMWLFQSRRASESITLQHTSNAPYYFGVKTQDESFSTVLEYDFELNGAEFWRKQRRELDSVKGVKDGIGCEKLKNFVRIPELDCSPMFFCQRYISVPHPNVNISPNPKSPSISLDGIEQFCSLGTFFRSFKSPPPRPHVIVLQHGYRGTAKDMGLLANSIRIFVPEAHVFCPTVNEDKLHASLEEMGSNLAEAVVSYVEKHCPDIHAGCGGLSFVGFSAGSLVIRCMLQSEKLRPFHHTMHLFLSLSSPHLGVSTFAGGGLLMTSAIWGLRKWRKKTVLDELTQSDAGSPRDTLLYRLSDSPYLALFRYVRHYIHSYTPDHHHHHHLAGLLHIVCNNMYNTTTYYYLIIPIPLLP